MSQAFLSRFVIAVALLALLAGAAQAQRGAITQSRNLEQLAGQAELIFRGRVTQVRVEPHPQLEHLNTVVVTLTVDEAIKGAPGRTVTFRQFIWDIRDRADAAGYAKGAEYLLLLNRPSQLGLTSPAGMEQGRFRISRDSRGRKLAANGADNHGLFTRIDSGKLEPAPALSRRAREHRQGALPLEELESAIRLLAETR